jgi:hypothetical protein
MAKNKENPPKKASADVLAELKENTTKQEAEKAQIETEKKQKKAEAGIKSKEPIVETPDDTDTASMDIDSTPKDELAETATAIEPENTTDSSSPEEPLVVKLEEPKDQKLQLVRERIEQRKKDREEERRKEDQEIAELREALELIKKQKASSESIKKEPGSKASEQKNHSVEELPEIKDRDYDIGTEYAKLNKEYNDTFFLRILKIRRLKKEMKKLKGEMRTFLSKEQEKQKAHAEAEFALKAKKEKEEEVQKIREEINLDKQAKPFLYYAAEKISNPIFERFKNSETSMLDFRWVSAGTESRAYQLFQYTTEDETEGYFNINMLGFVEIIKNVNDIRDNERRINVGSPEARFKILGPDGTIIEDDIEGYQEADKKYADAIEEYKKRLEAEFNNLPK